MDEKKEGQLASESDRATMRTYLEKRLKTLRRQAKRAGEREEGAFVEGAEMEIIFIYDELLGEQAPDEKTLRAVKKLRAV
jgi:hypothetical protein